MVLVIAWLKNETLYSTGVCSLILQLPILIPIYCCIKAVYVQQRLVAVLILSEARRLEPCAPQQEQFHSVLQVARTAAVTIYIVFNLKDHFVLFLLVTCTCFAGLESAEQMILIVVGRVILLHVHLQALIFFSFCVYLNNSVGFAMSSIVSS